MSESRIAAEKLVDGFISMLVNKGTIQRPKKEALTEVIDVIESWLSKIMSEEEVKGYADGMVSGKKSGLVEAMNACCDKKSIPECLDAIKRVYENVNKLAPLSTERHNEATFH